MFREGFHLQVGGRAGHTKKRGSNTSGSTLPVRCLQKNQGRLPGRWNGMGSGWRATRLMISA